MASSKRSFTGNSIHRSQCLHVFWLVSLYVVLMGPVMSQLQKCRATPHGSDTWHGTWGGSPMMGPLSPGSPMPKSLRVEFSPLFNRKWLALQVCNSCAGVGHWSPTLHCQSQLVWMWFEMNEEKDIWAFQGVTKIQPCIYIYIYCNSYKYMICYT